MPIHRRLPKQGFTNIFKKKIVIVNLHDLADRFESGSTVDEAGLIKAGLIKGQFDGIKVLGEGELARPLTIRGIGVSESARKKIEAAGGSVVA